MHVDTGAHPNETSIVVLAATYCKPESTMDAHYRRDQARCQFPERPRVGFNSH